MKEIGLAALVRYYYWENMSNFVAKPSWLNWELNRVLSVGRPEHRRGKSCQVICPNGALVVCFGSALKNLF